MYKVPAPEKELHANATVGISAAGFSSSDTYLDFFRNPGEAHVTPRQLSSRRHRVDREVSAMWSHPLSA